MWVLAEVYSDPRAAFTEAESNIRYFVACEYLSALLKHIIEMPDTIHNRGSPKNCKSPSTEQALKTVFGLTRSISQRLVHTGRPGTSYMQPARHRRACLRYLGFLIRA